MRHGRDDYAAIQDVGALLAAGVLQFGPNATDEDRSRLSLPATSIEADEPVFLLRSRDVAAGATVAFWTERAAIQGSDPAMLQTVRDEWAVQMADWGRQHGAKPADQPGPALPPGIEAVDPVVIARGGAQPPAALEGGIPAETPDPSQPDGGMP